MSFEKRTANGMIEIDLIEKGKDIEISETNKM